MKNFKKTTIEDINPYDCCISDGGLYVIDNTDDDFVIVRYDLVEIINSNGKDIKREIITTTDENAISIRVVKNWLIICSITGVEQYNMETHERSTVSKSRAIHATIAGENVYISYNTYEGLVKYNVTKSGLIEENSLFPYSLYSTKLNDEIILNKIENHIQIAFYIDPIYGSAFPIINILTDKAKDIVWKENAPTIIIGHDCLYFIRYSDDAVFYVKNITSFDTKIDADDLIELPIKLSKMDTGSLIDNYGFLDGVVAEFYTDLVYLEADSITILESIVVASYGDNETKSIAVCGEDCINIYTVIEDNPV